jgi:hypothetical protein
MKSKNLTRKEKKSPQNEESKIVFESFFVIE